LSAGTACLACNGAVALPPAIAGVDRLHAVDGSFQVAICSACGSGLTLPTASAEDLAAFYPQEYGPYGQPLHGLARLISIPVRAFHAWRTFRIEPLRVVPSLGTGRALDVGCPEHRPRARRRLRSGLPGRAPDPARLAGGGRGARPERLRARA
jgi:hypothetical protein